MSQKPRLTHKKDEVSNMKNAMTYAQALEIAINAVADNADAVSTLTALKAQIEKKNASKPSKPNKIQVANAEKRDAILAFLSDKTEPMTAAAIAEGMNEDKNSITGFLTRLAKDERVKVSKELPDGKKSKVNLYAVA